MTQVQLPLLCSK